MLEQITGGIPAPRMLNLGTGEGDYDATLKRYCQALDSCDINEDDIAHARAMNADVEGIRYSVEDAGALTYGDGSFDVVTCLEVIEHVDQPRRLLAEIVRVLRPGGHAVLTCPSLHFPPTYDPINYALEGSGKRVGFGAYGYGHSWLVDEEALRGWLDEAGLRVLTHQRLSKHLAGLLECYWPGALQRLLKANAGNRGGEKVRVARVRPSSREPRLVRVADALIDADARLFAGQPRSVGLGYLLRRVA